MRNNEEVSAVSFMASVARLPRSGMAVVIEADEKQRAALAETYALLSVERFRAELLVAPWKRMGIKVTGNVRAKITQQCGVTLEPLPTHVEEEVEGVYLPADPKLGRQGLGEAGEIHLDADGPDAPETFVGDSIDVGALAEEFFGLGIDPYPRKSGVSLDDRPQEAGSVEPLGPLQEQLRQLVRKE